MKIREYKDLEQAKQELINDLHWNDNLRNDKNYVKWYEELDNPRVVKINDIYYELESCIEYDQCYKHSIMLSDIRSKILMEI